MTKLFITALILSFFACSGKKSAEVATPAADTLMDSTAIKLRADTTVKQLDNLEDSINKEREKAAAKAN